MKKLSPLKKNTGLLIRIDDIAAHMKWDLIQKCEILFDELNIRPVLGVIPNNKDEEFLKYEKKDDFWDKVRVWQSKGWEISMHGFDHVYNADTMKKDFFGYGGKSEFYGHSLDHQKKRIEEGLKIFNKEKVNVRSFFAPNHTYDLNTFKALKTNGIDYVIDGYGLKPYSEFEINFIPQLFYKEIMLPFGIQTTQVHLNYMSNENFLNFVSFIKKNSSKIINFDKVIENIDNNILSKLSRVTIEKSLKLIRLF